MWRSQNRIFMVSLAAILGYVIKHHDSPSPSFLFSLAGEKNPDFLATAHHWDYKSHGDDWKGCEKESQSPINIPSVEGPPLTTLFRDQFKMKAGYCKPDSATAVSITHNGHSIQVENTNKSPMGSVEFNGKTYQAIQYHFHAGAEHTFGKNNERHLVEMHIVHKNNDNDLLVLGIVFDVPDKAGFKIMDTDYNGEKDENLPSNLFLQKLTDLENFPKKAGDFTEIEGARHCEILKELSIDGPLNILVYKGSLTTPPCSAVVTWLIADEIVGAPPEVFARFKASLVSEGGEDNFRDTQALDGRNIFHTEGELIVGYEKSRTSFKTTRR